MAQFIFTNLLLLSLGSIFYILARSLPRISEEEAGEKRSSFMEKIITSEIPHKLDAIINMYAGKIFRKMKVILLRLDNFLTDRLKKINSDQNGKQKIDFKEIVEEKVPAEGENIAS